MNVIFIHGATGSKNNFIYLEKYFPNSEAFDLIGFGHEAKPELLYDKKTFLNFLELKIKERCIIIGHSMGGIIAKDFALAHPEQVEKIFLISYPLQESKKDLIKIMRKDMWVALFMNNDLFSRLMCNSKRYYKYLVLPFAYIFYNKYYLSIRDYFLHTHYSLYNSIQNYILKDDYRTIEAIKDKAYFITGDKDYYVNKDLLKSFNCIEIPNMGHSFFGYENEISDVIHNHLN